MNKALELLKAAVCPCCDKSGAYHDSSGNVHQCQWCDEVSKLAAASKPEQQESPECRLVSYAEDGSTCTLNLRGEEIYFDRLIEQQEAPELTDEGVCQLAEKIDGIERHRAWGELIVRHSNGSWVTVERMLIQFARAVIAADRAKRGAITTKPTDDPAAAWRTEGFNHWRANRAIRTTKD
jgi:hypothetical protein